MTAAATGYTSPPSFALSSQETLIVFKVNCTKNRQEGSALFLRFLDCASFLNNINTPSINKNYVFILSCK